MSSEQFYAQSGYRPLPVPSVQQPSTLTSFALQATRILPDCYCCYRGDHSNFAQDQEVASAFHLAHEPFVYCDGRDRLDTVVPRDQFPKERFSRRLQADDQYENCRLRHSTMCQKPFSGKQTIPAPLPNRILRVAPL